MVSVTITLASGKVPFLDTFACFLARACDQVRMAAISWSNINLCGSHCGVSIGEDGPSQMAPVHRERPFFWNRCCTIRVSGTNGLAEPPATRSVISQAFTALRAALLGI